MTDKENIYYLLCLSRKAVKIYLKEKHSEWELRACPQIERALMYWRSIICGSKERAQKELDFILEHGGRGHIEEKPIREI